MRFGRGCGGLVKINMTRIEKSCYLPQRVYNTSPPLLITSIGFIAEGEEDEKEKCVRYKFLTSQGLGYQ